MISFYRDLSIIRGDTISIGLTINGLDDDPAELYFSVKKYYSDREYVIHKSLDDGITDEGEGRYVVVIESEETEQLPTGTYVYDVEVTVNNTRRTLVRGNFELDPDVTRHLED